MKYQIILALFFSVIIHHTYAQTTAFSGQVTIDGKESAIGAYVILENTNFQTTTDLEGKFAFPQVPAGEYLLIVSYVGAKPYRNNINITNERKQLTINLISTNEILETVTVVSKSESREQAEQAIEIESIELKDLVSQIKDVSEAIDRLSGVRVRGTGSFGDQADISINGLNGTAVRSYIDGLPLDFIYPQFSFNNLPIDNIKRIDVYKGVVPIDVGTDALGGGINAITQSKPFNEIKASYGYGSFNTHQANASVNYKLTENVVLNVNGTYNAADNNYEMEAFVWESRERETIQRFHDDYRFLFGSVGVEIRQQSWADRLRVSVNYGDYEKEIQHGGRIGNFAFGGANYTGDAISTILNYDKKIGEKFKLETAFAYSDNNIIFTDTTANVFSWSGAIISRRNRGGEFGGSSLTDRNFKNTINRVNLKYELSPQDEISLSNLIAHQTTIGEDRERNPERDFLRKKQFLTKDIIGLQYQIKLFQDKLILAAAGKFYYFKIAGIERFSEMEIERTGEQFGYYFSGKYNFTDRFFVRTSYESALRIPTFNQFFGNGATIISSVELQPESSDNINLGFAYRTIPNGRIQFGIEANGFYRGQNDIIYLTQDIFQQYQNAEEVRTVGIDGDFFIDLWYRLNFNFNATRLAQTYESINESNVAGQFLVGTPFPNVPKFFTNLRITYRVDQFLNKNHRFLISVQHKFVDEFNFINVGQIYDPNNFVPVQHRFDAGIVFTGWDNKITLALNVNNLLDAAIFDNFSIPRPGRSYNFKMTYRLFDF